MHELLTYPILAILTTLYALFLESRRRDPKRTYAPRWTWLTVVAGVTIVGGMTALHLWIAGPPPLSVQDTIWWSYSVWVLHFVFGGLPIILWQEIVDRRDLETALKRAMERHKE